MDRRPPGPSAAGRWMAASVAAAVLVLGVTSCADDDEAKGPTATVGSSPPTTEPAPTTTTVDDVKADVEAAYLDAEASYYAALEAPDPTDPRIAAHRAGKNLEKGRAYVASLVERGLVVRYPEGPPDITIESVVLGEGGLEAEVVSCAIDTSQVVDGRTGEVVDGETATWRQSYHLELMDGEWMVTSGKVLEEALSKADCS